MLKVLFVDFVRCDSNLVFYRKNNIKLIMASDGTFLVSYTGQLVYVNITAASGTTYYCKYDIISGTDWNVISGLEAGVTQTAEVVTNGDKVVYNFPIEITFRATNPFGWPQIIMTVYSDRTLQGYGRIHMPFQPGLHVLRVPLSKPVPLTYLGYLSSIFGYQTELLQGSLLASGEANHMMTMESSGYASVSINVLIKGFKELGYDVGCFKQ